MRVSHIAICSLFLMTAIPGFSQNSGPRPFDSYQEEINLGTLQPSIAIHIFKKAIRGGGTIDFTLRNNGANFSVDGQGNWKTDPGWVVDSKALAVGRFTSTVSSVVCHYPNHVQKYSNWTFIDAAGTVHNNNSVSITTYAPNTCGFGTSGSVTADMGSGYFVSVVNSNQPSATSPDGVTTAPAPTGLGTVVTDRNGNQVTYTFSGGTETVTDTTGAVALTVYSDYNVHFPPAPSTYTWTAPDGSNVTATLTYATYTFATNFQCSGFTDVHGSSIYLPSILSFPDGSEFTFGYETTPGYSSGNTTGRLASITLPSGGVIAYDFSGSPNDDMNCTPAIIGQGDTRLLSLKKTTPDGVWNYTNTLLSYVSGHNSQYKTTVLDPANNLMVAYFSIQTGVGKNHDSHETERLQYSGPTTSTLLQTQITCYNGLPTPCTSASNTQDMHVPITQIVTQTILPSGKMSQSVELQDPYGFLVQEKDDYDYGVGGPGQLLRKTLFTYGSFNGSGCTPLGNHLTSLPCTETVQDGNSVQLSQKRFSYDETGVAAHIQTTPQHISVSGSRGNLTTASSWVSGSTYLSTTSTFYDTGNLNVTTRPNLSSVTFGYPDASTTCGNTFATSVSQALGISTQAAWDCHGGVQTKSIDANGQVITYGYLNQAGSADPLWRLLSINDPLNNTTWNTYSPGGTIPATLETSITFNNGTSSVDTLTTFDSLGRAHLKQTRQAPGSTSFDTVVSTYDPMGRVSTVGLPCVSTASTPCSSSGTTTTFDPLSRTLQVTDGGGGYRSYSYTDNDVLVSDGPAPAGENTKQRQLEYDGLGRSTSVCEVTSGTTQWPGGNCGQAAAETGYLTSYAYRADGRLTGVTMNNQSATKQTRSYSYDALGRLLSEMNPESGTTSYVYDTDATCGTSNGDLVKRTDAVGNVVCYKYDLLHRKTSISHPSGSYATVTPDKCFVYDSATVRGVSMSNANGRLAEAYTVSNAQGCSASKITDEGFSYSSRGEIASTWEYTLAFGNWYQTTATYWANGALATLGGLTSVPAFTFGVEGEGRISSVSASSGQNPVTTTSYNPDSQLTGVTLGSGDSDSFTFDANTGRMTQYKATINGSSAFGNLTWNPDGSLKQLAITDPFNSSDTETCSYSQGDLASIKSVSCGSAWSQTFTYDPFGNITKSGSISWMPGYNAATNRYTLGGTSYDADGNLLTDTFHTYTWNSDGQPATVNTNTLVILTYDALGRVVILNDAGAKTDIAYTPSGRRFAYYPAGAFGGFTLDLPGLLRAGGQTANAGVQSYSHPDWLGSQRLISAINRSYIGSLAYAPFGETYARQGLPQLLFTNQSNDIANDLYDFPAREQQGAQGRWISPDPAGMGAVDPTNPQSWNRYAYVMNHPLTSTDPFGTCESSDRNPKCRTFVVDGVEVPASIGIGVLRAGAGAQCPQNDCSGVKLNNFNEFYRTSYRGSRDGSNPDIFQWDSTGFYPTHWVTRYLGNADLPWSILCVHIGATCDKPIPGSRDIFRNSRYCATCGSVLSGAKRVADAAFVATGVQVAAPLVLTIGGKAAVTYLLIGSTITEFINQTLEPGQTVNVHIPDQEREPEETSEPERSAGSGPPE